MAYKDIYNYANNNEYKGRLAAALVDAAIAVNGESDTTPNHANRVEFAHAVAANPASYAERMVWAVATVAAGESDANLKAAALLVWNAFAKMEVA
jgi:hypothetical protein